MLLENLVAVILFILPAYIANSSPVIFGGGEPMDFGKNFADGRRILGDGKTWRGFFVGVAGAVLTGIIVYYIVRASAQYAFWENAEMEKYVLLGFLLGVGTMLGDALGSFIKRRMNMEPGKPAFLQDQLLFLVLALIFALPLMPAFINLEAVIFLVALTYVLHVSTNFLANRVGLKKVPW
ncbi:MAG: CDP-2,3-bis-(O-geranylgeranyl)-sn-glycerol synthase [Candidatus Micrarchaeota archaeon]